MNDPLIIDTAKPRVESKRWSQSQKTIRISNSGTTPSGLMGFSADDFTRVGRCASNPSLGCKTPLGFGKKNVRSMCQSGSLHAQPFAGLGRACLEPIRVSLSAIL
jgi:hypothetical protein